MGTNPFAPNQNLPFQKELTEPPQSIQQAQQQQFSGYPQGKLGVTTGLVAKFLAGAAEGRMRQAQRVENENAQKFAAIARLGQQIENDPTLTPEAKSSKTNALIKLQAQMVLSQTGGDKKKSGSDNPVLGFIKGTAERLAGGPLPKKWEGPTTDEILKIVDRGPQDTIQGQAQQIETQAVQALAAWQKANPGKLVTTEALQSSGFMKFAGQAQQMGIQSPAIAAWVKSAQENDARRGREEETEKRLKEEKEYKTGKQQFIKIGAGGLPEGTKDINDKVIPSDHASYEIRDADNRFVGYQDAGAVATARPKFTLGPTSNPLWGSQLGGLKTDKLGTPINLKGQYLPVLDDKKNIVGAVPFNIADSIRLDADGNIIRMQKFSAPRAPTPPGTPGGQQAPRPPGSTSPSTQRKSGQGAAAQTPPVAASAQVKSYADRVQNGDLRLDQVPAKQRGRVSVYLDSLGVKPPVVLSAEAQKTIEATKPVLDQINAAMKALEPLKDDNTPTWVPGSAFFDDYVKYKAGASSQYAGLIANLSMSSILGASRILKGGGGVRAKAIFEEAQQHTPKVGKDSPKLIYEKLLQMKKSIENGNAALYEYGKKSGAAPAPAAPPPPGTSNGRTQGGAPKPLVSPAQTAAPKVSGLTVTFANGSRMVFESQQQLDAFKKEAGIP